MTEAGRIVDVQVAKSEMDKWLGVINPFPRERVIGEGGREEFVEGRTVEISDQEDPTSKIIFFVNRCGIFITEQSDSGLIDLGNAVAAEAEDYVLYGKVVKSAIVEGQRNLSYQSPASTSNKV